MPVQTPPSQIETWLLTRIATPILSVILIFFVVNFWFGQNKCKNLCREKGYKQSNYIAPYRFSDGKCICEDPLISDNSNQKIELRIR